MCYLVCMAIGFGFSEEKIAFWKALEEVFRRAYPDLKYGEGVTLEADVGKYDKMKEWTKALSRAHREELDELVMEILRGKE